jgi:hypothetical protein
MARLGEGAPWIYKIMSHIYTSLAFALKQNKELLLACSPEFHKIVGNIEQKQFSGSQSELARELNFALKTAAKMVNHFKQVYVINETMRAEIDFIRQALREDSGISFLKYQLPSSFQELQRLLCLGTAPFELAVAYQPYFGFGGTYHSRMTLFIELYCT